MNLKDRNRLTQGLLGVVVLMCAPAVTASTLCTHIVQSPEYPIPMDERESDRQVQARVLPGFVAEGDELTGEGKLAEAVAAYAKVLSGGFSYRGTYPGDARCLPTDFYQDAADKLRAVASRLAERRKAKGYLLDEMHEYGGDFEHGALRLYLVSNQYDSFITEAFAYAEAEFLARDIDEQLMAMVRGRLGELEEYRNDGHAKGRVGYVDDRTPLLAEERAAFTKLAGFDEALKMRFASRYPEITDHSLAEEERNFNDAIRGEGMILSGMIFARGTDALERGMKRLYEHPDEMERLRRRADARGNTLMTRAQYAPAEAYFEIAGNDDLAAKAGRLAETQAEAMAERFEASVQSDLEKFRKSEQEQAAFQEETDEMAAEFGFDIEE